MSLGRAWRWHDEPALAAWVATPVGKVAVWLAALLLVPDPARLPVAVALAPTLAWPARRIDVLALAAVGVLLAYIPSPVDATGLALRGLTALIVLGLLLGFWQAARRFRDLPSLVRRFPIATAHAVLLGLAVGSVVLRKLLHVEHEAPAAIPLVGLQTVALFLLWRVSYLMLAGRRGTVAKDRFRDHLFYLLPLWGGTKTPYGKGHGYLMQRYATSEADLAATRLSGIKLLGLAWVWAGVDLLVHAAVHGIGAPGLGWLAARGLGIPLIDDAILAGPSTHALVVRWGVVLAALVGKVLGLAVYGHAVIGIVRLFGFRLFRNTYKPLLAPSLVEFWNRYFYYFKELMVEFFFYPTYVATAGRSQRTRIFLAIMAAAGAGNLYYHVLRDFGPGMVVDASATWSPLAARTTYSVVLALGIYVSMLREQARRARKGPPPGVLRQLRAIAGVWIFFGVLVVWSVASTRFGFGQRLRYTLGLVGITQGAQAAHE